MELEHFAELHNKQLFTRVVQSLWTLYDNGGISFGRSYIASLLECCRSFLDFEDLPSDLEGNPIKVMSQRLVEYDGAIRESQVHETKWIQLELPFDDIQTLSNQDLIFVLLRESCRWYEEEAESSGFQYREPRILTEVLGRFCEIVFPDTNQERIKHVRFDKESILEKCKNRKNWFLQMSARSDEFDRFGISPWIDYGHTRFWIKTQ